MPDRYTTRLLVALALMLGPLRLSLAQETHYFQSWSPSGDTMLFSSTVGPARGLSLRAMDTGTETATTIVENGIHDGGPSWSPLGGQFAHTSVRDDNTGEVENYAFSHDGSAIVYDTDASGSYQVYRMRPDGTPKRRLTYLGVPVKYPYFTRDDRQLVIHYKMGDDTHIALMDLPSLQVTSLTADHFAPLTFPDHLKIAFTSYRGGSADVYFINPDGTGLTQITDVRLSIRGRPCSSKPCAASWCGRVAG